MLRPQALSPLWEAQPLRGHSWLNKETKHKPTHEPAAVSIAVVPAVPPWLCVSSLLTSNAFCSSKQFRLDFLPWFPHGWAVTLKGRMKQTFSLLSCFWPQSLITAIERKLD